MVISVIVLVVCVAGLIGTWYYNTPVTQAILDVVVPVTDALQLAEEVTSETGAVLETVSVGLDGAQQQIEAIGEEVVDADIAVEAISTLVGEDIQPKVDEVKSSIKTIYDTLGIMQEAIQAFNDIPFIDPEVPGGEELGQVRTGMEEVVVQTDDVRSTLVDRKVEIVEGAVDEIIGPLNELSTLLGETRTTLGQLEQSLKESVETLIYVRDNTAFWVDMVCVVLTLILVWILISQIAVFVLSRKILKEM